MSTADTIYGVRWHGPELLERGRDNVATCPVRRSGATPTVSTATATLKRGSTTVQSPTVTSLDPPTATFTTAVLASEQYGYGYTIEWAVTIDGKLYTYDRPAVLCRRALFPVVTEADLTQLHPDVSGLLPTGTSLQQWIDAAWEEIVNRLVASGTLPDLIVEPTALRSLHRYLALHLMFQAWGTSLQGGSGNRWVGLAEGYGGKYERAWGRVSWLTDTDRDGVPDDIEHKQAARPTIFLNGRGSGWY